MAVIKANVQEKFFVITNDTARDAGLSLEAKGLIMVMASRPAQWRFNKSQLMQECGIGREKLARIFKELVDSGYLDITQEKGDDGRFQNTTYYFYADPSNNHNFTPLSEKPLTAETGDGETAPIKERVSSKERSKQNVQPIVEQGFGIFWKYYPKKIAKQEARKAYEKLMKGKSDEGVQETTEAMVNYMGEAMQSLEAGDSHFIGYDNMNASTYINQRRWEDC